MTSHRVARVVRLRARTRAARLHPAARTRATRATQRRHLMTFGVQMVRAGHGRPSGFLCAFAIGILCKFSPGLVWVLTRHARPGLLDRLAELVERVTLAATAVAVRTRGRIAAARVHHLAEIRSVAAPVRGPNVRSDARPVFPGGYMP